MAYYTNVQKYGNNILYVGYDDEGEKVRERIKYKPKFYIPSKDEKHRRFKDIFGNPLADVPFETMKEAKEFYNTYRTQCYGMERFQYAFIAEKHLEDETVPYDYDSLIVLNFDIEVSSKRGFPFPEKADQEITLITFTTDGKEYHVIGTNPDYESPNPDWIYHYCEDEKTLLLYFIKFVQATRPDILTGWNIENFDIPYIINRAKNIGMEKEVMKLSLWNIIQEEEKTFYNKTYITYNILGLAVMDYCSIFQKFDLTKYESYRLDHIAHMVLGKRKVDYTEYPDLNVLMEEDYDKFVEYGVTDTQLVDELEDNKNFMKMLVDLAYDARVNFEDVFYQVRMWDVICYNFLLKDNIICPPKLSHGKESYAGGFVKAPQVGIHDWVVSFDLNSLYPNIISQFNISPETLLDYKHWFATVDDMLNQIELQGVEGNSCCANGYMFRNDIRGFFPKLMDKFYAKRKHYQKLMYEARDKGNKADEIRYNIIQYSRKISINSAYGALGNNYFRFFDVRIASAVTLTGQFIIQWVNRDINRALNKVLKSEDVDYCLAIDTDSGYFTLKAIVDKFSDDGKNVVDKIDRICEGMIQPVIEKSLQNLAEYTNSYENKMGMKRECIADRGIWTAKKRYILNVWDKEGKRYKEPQLKLMGIDAVKSSTPEIVRSKMKDSFKILINQTNQDLIDFKEEFYGEFRELPIQDISFPSGVNGLEKYYCPVNLYKKGTPFHVRGSLLYNHYLKKAGLENKYPLIYSGDKIKCIYLKMPNPIHEDTIAFPMVLPEELGLHKYIDYKTQFYKSYAKPVEDILHVIGWTFEDNRSIF